MSIRWITAVVCLTVSGCGTPAPCVKSHVERRPTWVQFVLVDRVMVPITHPAANVIVCDDRSATAAQQGPGKGEG